MNNKLTIRSGDIVVFTAAKAGDVVGCGLVLCSYNVSVKPIKILSTYLLWQTEAECLDKERWFYAAPMVVIPVFCSRLKVMRYHKNSDLSKIFLYTFR